MVEVKTKDNTLICILTGVLDGKDSITIPVEATYQKIQLIGENIQSWNTDFVVTH